MNTLQLLARDHRWIERMLACLEALIVDSLDRGRLDAEASTTLLSLFEHFADGIHQRKEESVLYMRLLNIVDPSERASIARFLGDHERDRVFMKQMRSSLLGAVFGRPEDVRDFAEMGQRYLEFQRGHLARENEVLLPMAARFLDAHSDRLVCEGFRRLEADAGFDLRAVAHQIESSCQRLGVTFSVESLESNA